MALNKNYKEFICSILDCLDNWRFDEYYFSREQKLPNIINSCVFIIHDKDKFIKLISDTLYVNCEGSVNQGPKAKRGQISSAFNFFIRLR